MGTTPQSIGKAFQNHHCCPFTHDKAIALSIERPRGLLGFLIAFRQGASGIESSDAYGSDGCFRTAGQHHVSITAPDNLAGLANGIRPAGAGGSGTKVRSLGTQHYGDMPGSSIGDHHGNQEGAYPARSFLCQHRHLSRKRGYATYTTADKHTNVTSILRVMTEIKLCLGCCLKASHHRELCIAIHTSGFAVLDVVSRIEALDLGGDPGLVTSGVEQGEAVNAGPASLESLPERGDVEHQRADYPHAGA